MDTIDNIIDMHQKIMLKVYNRAKNQMRINHSKLFADKQNHINGIENFWNQAKRHLRKFNGIPRQNFGLFLKECEWRFNTPTAKAQLTQLNQWLKGCL